MWKKKNDERKFRKKIKSLKKKKARKRKTNLVVSNNNLNNRKPNKVFKVPFSIIKNPEETIEFFNTIIKEIKQIRQIVKQRKNKYNFIRLFLIDMSEINKITGDALMYLLTIVKNTRGPKS